MTTVTTIEKLRQEDTGALLGHLVVPEGVRMQEQFEYAAWYRTHELKPGRYPLTVQRRPLSAYWTLGMIATVPSTIVAAYLGTHYGGVGIGKDRAGADEIGKAGERDLGRWFAHYQSTGDAVMYLPAGVTFEPAMVPA